MLARPDTNQCGLRQNTAMKPTHAALLLTFLACCAGSSSPAALIERDWLTPGDGLLTYDPVHGREWLDLTVTDLGNYGPPGSLVDDLVPMIAEELLPGGRLEGFTWAGRTEVEELIEVTGFDSTSLDTREETADALRAFIRLIDSPAAIGELTGSGATRGVINEVGPPPVETLSGYVVASFVVEARRSFLPNGRGQTGFVNPANQFDAVESIGVAGLMLYREAIPEPSAIQFVAIFALSVLLGNRR